MEDLKELRTHAAMTARKRGEVVNGQWSMVNIEMTVVKFPKRCEKIPPSLSKSLYFVYLRTIHDSRFTIHDSRFTIHDSRFTIHDSRFPIHDSRFTMIEKIY